MTLVLYHPKWRGMRLFTCGEDIGGGLTREAEAKSFNKILSDGWEVIGVL